MGASPFEEIFFSKAFHSVNEDKESELSKVSSIKDSEVSKVASLENSELSENSLHREITDLSDNMGSYNAQSQNHQDRCLRLVCYKKGGHLDEETKRLLDSISYHEQLSPHEIPVSKHFFPIGEGLGSEVSSAFDGSILSSIVMAQSACSEDMGTVIDNMSLGTNTSHLDRSI